MIDLKEYGFTDPTGSGWYERKDFPFLVTPTRNGNLTLVMRTLITKDSVVVVSKDMIPATQQAIAMLLKFFKL